MKGMIFLLHCLPGLLLAADPLVTQVSASQRAGSTLVDVSYDLWTDDGQAAVITARFSSDNGQSWSIVPASLSGDYGAGVFPGSSKHFVWDAGYDNHELNFSNMRVNVQACQGQQMLQPNPIEGQDLFITSVYYGGGVDDFHLRVGGWGDEYRSLLYFNVANLPLEVSNVSLQLYSFFDGHNGTTSIYLDRVTSVWNEQTRWISRPTFQSVRTIPAPIYNSYYTIDVTDIYLLWKSNPQQNYGLQLRPTSTSNRMNAFFSSDYTEIVERRPKLILTY